MLGTPAEEGGCAKLILQEAGALEGCDYAMMAHPCCFTMTAPHIIALDQCVLRNKSTFHPIYAEFLLCFILPCFACFWIAQWICARAFSLLGNGCLGSNPSRTAPSQWRYNGARWLLNSPALRLFTQPFIQAQIKEIIKAPRHWPLCGEFTGTGEFRTQSASNAENSSIWWRHRDKNMSRFDSKSLPSAGARSNTKQ